MSEIADASFTRRDEKPWSPVDGPSPKAKALSDAIRTRARQGVLPLGDLFELAAALDDAGIATLLASLPKSSDPLARRRVEAKTCGKSKCACKRDLRKRHGPYIIEERWVDGKRRRKVISRVDALLAGVVHAD